MLKSLFNADQALRLKLSADPRLWSWVWLFLMQCTSERARVNTIRKLGLCVHSVEALRDTLIELSIDEVKVNVVTAATGGISETDVNLAIASKAIIIGFNVRPAGKASGLAQKEQIEIRQGLDRQPPAASPVQPVQPGEQR